MVHMLFQRMKMHGMHCYHYSMGVICSAVFNLSWPNRQEDQSLGFVSYLLVSTGQFRTFTALRHKLYGISWKQNSSQKEFMLFLESLNASVFH